MLCGQRGIRNDVSEPTRYGSGSGSAPAMSQAASGFTNSPVLSEASGDLDAYPRGMSSAM